MAADQILFQSMYMRVLASEQGHLTIESVGSHGMQTSDVVKLGQALLAWAEKQE